MEIEEKETKDMNLSESIRKARKEMTRNVGDAIVEYGLYNVQPCGNDTLMLYNDGGECVGFALLFTCVDAIKEEEDANA
jgi:hypothetical protein